MRRQSLLLPFVLLVACDTGPLAWAETMPDESPPATPALPALATRPADPRGTMCDSSLRVVAIAPGPAGATPNQALDHAAMGHAMPAAPAAAAGADSARLVAVWWAVRPDSTAWLLSARGSAGGAAWEPAVPVDTMDRGPRGCARPAPSVAWTGENGYVHVAYWLDAPEGAGVFYAHSMLRGRLYDTEPQPIAYGPRVSRSAVAARGDTVVVAFEDPNGRAAAMVLALSLTTGHGFVDKSIRASPGDFAAMAPWVAVDSAGVLVRWSEQREGRAVPLRRRGRVRA